MSGDPGILACDAAGLSEEGQRKRLLCKVVCFLLTYQFVPSRRHLGRLWRVQTGAGMEMKNSGELSEGCIAFLVERLCLKPDTLSAFSINLYGRFKHDIIIVARNPALTKHFFWCTKRRSKYCKIKVEEITISRSPSVERRFFFRHRLSSSQVCGNHWEQTALMLFIATRRGPLRASPCLARCREIHPSSRKPNKS